MPKQIPYPILPHWIAQPFKEGSLLKAWRLPALKLLLLYNENMSQARLIHWLDSLIKEIFQQMRKEPVESNDKPYGMSS